MPETTEATRRALESRLSSAAPAPATLIDLARIIVPSGWNVDPAWVAGEVHARLSRGETDGWRFDQLPPDPEAWRIGIERLEPDPTPEAIENAGRGAEGWPFPSDYWMEEVRGEMAKVALSHPNAYAAIGYDGFADGRGRKNVGLGELDAPLDAEIHIPSLPQGPDYGDACDVVIVGSGAGGAPLAAALCRAGVRVILLEAGAHHRPVEFASDERANEFLFWNDERLSAGEHPIAFGSNNSGQGVGGSTLHWTAYTPPLYADDFRMRTSQGVGLDWPFGLEEIQPYIDRVIRVLGVSGPGPDYPNPPLPRNSAAHLMARGCDALGIPYQNAANAAPSRPYFHEEIGWRSMCTGRGFCQAGCSIGAKGSADVTWLPMAARHGLELRPNARVVEILTEGDRVVGVVYRQGGAENRLRAENVFLCAGGIETPRLLLMNRLGNEHVGRWFLAHPGLQLFGFFEEITKPWRGIPGGLFSGHGCRPSDADFAGGYILQSIGIMPLTYVGQVARGAGLYGERLGEHMARFSHVAGINICGECLPKEENRLELSGENDAHGLPKPRIFHTRGPNEEAIYRHGERTMRAIWEAAGATGIWTFAREAHTLGTCRMTDDPNKGVVDSNHRVHGIRGLYVCDNSVYPSSLSTNPAMVQMALSLRLADLFLRS